MVILRRPNHLIYLSFTTNATLVLLYCTLMFLICPVTLYINWLLAQTTGMCTVHWSTHMPQVSYFYSMSLFFVMCLSDFILFIIDTSVLKTENTSFTVYTSALILFSPNLVPVLRAQWLIPSHAMVATLQLDQDTSTSYTWSLSLQQEMTKQDDASPSHHHHQKKKINNNHQ